MSMLSVILPRAFKAQLPDPAFPLTKRFSDHRISAFDAAFVDEHVTVKHLRLNGRLWEDTSESPAPGTPGVALITTPSLLFDSRDLPQVPGGNTEHNIARAVAEKPALLLKDTYDASRGYHILPLDGRKAMIFSVVRSDVHRAEVALGKHNVQMVRAACGLACATKLALVDQPKRFPRACAVIVNDQRSILTLPISNGRIDKPLLVTVREAEMIDDVRDIAIRAAEAASEAGDRPTVVVYSTPSGVLKNVESIASSGYSSEFVSLATADLCFA